MTTVLLIEDNKDIRENTEELLILRGFRVVSAVNGKSGLELAREEGPDIILCDIMMPEVDGYRVLTELRQNPETSSIPFIFLTASVERKEVEKAFGMGVQGYIRKPFADSELFDTIAACLNRK